MINSNPETVSTDFDASSRLYFEPLDPESVRSVIDAESPTGGDPSRPSSRSAARRRSTSPRRWPPAACRCSARDLEAIDQAEERVRFAALLDRLGIPQPEGGMAHSVEEALTLAERIGYPVIVRPSFVIGGLAIDFCYSPEDLARQLALGHGRRPRPAGPHRPLPRGRRGRRRRRQRRRARAHPGPPRARRAGRRPLAATASASSRRRPSARATRTSSSATMERIVLALGARGLVNAQFIVRDDGVYLIEVNPRASRTVPFMSKVTGVPMVELAVRIALGATLAELGWDGGLLPPPPFVAVKAPAFSTAKLRGVDPSVGPGMQSTGEVIGIHEDPRVALAKALLGAALVPPRPGRGRRARAAVDRRPRQGAAAAARRRAWPAPATGSPRHPARGARSRRPATTPGRSPSSAKRRTRRSARSPILDLIATRRGAARRQHADPALGRGPRRRRDPPAATAEGILVPDRDRDGGGRRRGARPGDRRRASEVRSLGEWVPEPGQPRLVATA